MKIFSPKNSIIVNYILILILIILIPVSALAAIALNYIDKIEKQSAEQYLSSNLTVVSSTIDTILSNLENSHTNLILDIKFTKTIKKLRPYANREMYPDYLQTELIKEKLSKTSLNSNYIYSAYAYSYTANRIFSSKISWDKRFNDYDKINSDWLQTYAAHKLSSSWYITSSIEDNKTILSSYREIKELDMPLYGLVSINVDSAVISGLLEEIIADDNGYCFLLDKQGAYISANGQISSTILDNISQNLSSEMNQGFFPIMIEDEKHYTFYKVSPYSQFTYVIALPLNMIETITPVVRYLNILFLMGITIMLLLTIIVSYFYLYKPIRTLFQSMHKLQEGDFSVRLPENTTYEIDYINSNFNNMVININELIQENYMKELLNKDAELKMLRSKLNEHFLYNTLDTIHWKARAEDAPKTCKMIFQLADFYRLSLSSGKEFVNIRQIIKLIQTYLEIQKERLGNSLAYTIEYPDEILDYTVLKYLFQPLVENSIIHGSRNIAYTETINITFNMTCNSIIFTVRDNGSGLSSQRLDELLASINGEEVQDGKCFALKTLNTQLHKYYGENSTLHIISNEHQGCSVWFELPSCLLKEEP